MNKELTLERKIVKSFIEEQRTSNGLDKNGTRTQAQVVVASSMGRPETIQLEDLLNGLYDSRFPLGDWPEILAGYTESNKALLGLIVLITLEVEEKKESFEETAKLIHQRQKQLKNEYAKDQMEMRNRVFPQLFPLLVSEFFN